jgi:NADH-quinone oxidoreductase subunit F
MGNSPITVLVCCGTGCLANGSKAVYQAFAEGIKALDLDIKVLPHIKATGCHGLCQKGPLVHLKPQNITYIKVKEKDVPEIIEKTLIGGETVNRLLYLDPGQKKKVQSKYDWTFCNKQVKFALRNVGEIDAASIDDYLERGGYTALEKALKTMQPQEVIAQVKASGLRGRGGGGFYTGIKWELTAKEKAVPKYVVCNGDEGDPGAFMDRSIMEGDPHTVLEGMAICAYAIGAREGFLYIRDEYGLAIENMKKAIAIAKKRGYLGEDIFGSGFSFDAEIVRGGGAFVCGEEMALIASIEGKTGEPRPKPPYPAQRGLWGQPTVINNVETWANIPLIINNGANWFSSVGTEKSKGTKVFALVGKVNNTGLVEVPMGITLREVIFEIGGGIPRRKKFKAVQTGGPSGGCIPEEQLDLPIDFDSLTEAGSMMGSGGLVVMDERTCMVDFARYYMDFLSGESCGKCVPCREGIKKMLEILTDICEGRGQKGDIELLEEIGKMVQKGSLCGLGKTAPNPVLSTIRYFRDEYEEHIEKHRCPAGVCKPLTELYIDQELCNGCGLCTKECATSAITGELKKPHTLDNEKCTKCGLCLDTCRFNAIKVR